MKLAVAVLALLCLGMGANANNKNLGVKVDKTDKGLHVDLPDITVPKVSMPEVNVAVEVKKPTISATKIDLPDFTIPTKEITIPTLPLPEIDLSALTALLSKGANSSASLAGFLKKSDLDLSALQNAVNGAMQIKTALTADAAAALQTMATAVYQAKYNVTSKIADLALEALSKKPSISIPTIQVPSIDLSTLKGLSKEVPTIDVKALLQLLLSAKDVMPTVTLPSIDKQSIAAMFDKSNATFDINGVVDKTALKQAIAQLLATVEKPSININGLVDMLNARKNGTSDLSALISNLTQKKDIKADLVGLLNSLKQEKTIDITLPTIPKPNVDIAGILETVNTLKNMTASIVTDDLKSAAILSWLKDAGFYQLKDAVNGAGKGKGKGGDGSGAVTINLGKQ